jgi:hypothetical protein
MDRELAVQVLEHEEGSTGTEPDTPVGYGLDSYLLLSIIDALRMLSATVATVAGAAPPELIPAPRPTTAVELLREERRIQSMERLIEQFSQCERL